MGQAKFTIKEEHLKLLRRANIRWEDCEFGAPAIDCKRPYGNSSVYEDIAKILGIVPEGEDEFSEKQETLMNQLHHDLETVLQIAVVLGYFKPGDYVQKDEYDYRTWERVQMEI